MRVLEGIFNQEKEGPIRGLLCDCLKLKQLYCLPVGLCAAHVAGDEELQGHTQYDHSKL